MAFISAGLVRDSSKLRDGIWMITRRNEDFLPKRKKVDVVKDTTFIYLFNN